MTTAASVTVTIGDNDEGEPAITVFFEKTFYQFAENALQTYVWVRAETATATPPAADFGVTVVSRDGTAVAGSDYTAVSETLAFRVSDFVLEDGRYGVTLLLRFYLIHDEIIERTEEFEFGFEEAALPPDVAVASDNRFGSGRHQAVVEIRDHWVSADGPMSPTATVTLDAPDRVDEGEAFDVTIAVDKEVAFPWNVNFSTVEGTAAKGDDYEHAVHVVQFEAGQRMKQVQVATLDDGLVEGDEQFQVLLMSSAIDGLVLPEPPSRVVTITDTDGPPGAPRDLRATPGDGLVELSWAPPPPKDDPLLHYEVQVDGGGWRSVGLETTDRVENLTNGRAYTFEVRAVNAAGAGPPASVTATPGRVVTRRPVRFEEGESSTVTILPPGAPFETDQTLTLVLASGRGAKTVPQPVAGDDYTVELNGMELSPQIRNLQDAYSFSGPQPHYPVTLPAGAISVAVRVIAVDDGEPEPSERLVIYVFHNEVRINRREIGADNLYIEASDRSAVPVSASIGRATVTVTFNRTVELRNHPGIDISAWETFFLLFTGAEPVLNRHRWYENAPGHPAGVHAESVAVSGRTLTLTFPEPVAADERVWVAYDRTSPDAPLGDPLERTNPHAEPPGRFAIEATNLTSAPAAALSSLSVGDAAATESGNGTDTFLTFTVTLEPESSETVTVEYATADGTATAGDDYTAASGTLTFEPGDTQNTVRVTVLDDSVEDGGETLTLTLSSPANATLGDAAATATILDDDDSAAPLTASFSDMPASHAGAKFTFGLTFSEEPHPDFSYKTLRDKAFEVTGGAVRNARRQEQGSNQGWNITVEPTSATDTVAITLPETTDCGASGAICTGDGRPLSHSLSDTVVVAA